MVNSQIGTLVVKLAMDASAFGKGISDAQSKLASAGQNMQALGGKLTAGLTLPLIGAGTAAIAFATDYNAALANVQSLGLPIDRINEFKSAIQDMAVDVGKAPRDLAEGMYQVISAFGDSGDSLAILEINAKAAAAGLASTTEAINLTSAVTKGYGDTTAEAVQKAADLAFETVKLGQTTFPELAASIGLVVPLAASLKVSQEELFGVMATGTGVTGTASQVATQLRGVLQSLMAPTKGMTELLASMGYESGQAMLDQLGLKGTIDAIVKASTDAGVPLQSYISSIEGQTLALALAGPQSDTFAQKLEAMTDTSGAVNEAFLAQTEGVNKAGFEMEQVQAKVTVLAQKLGDALAPALNLILEKATPMIDWLTNAVDGFMKLDPQIQTMILAAGGLAAALGPVLAFLGMMSNALFVLAGPAGWFALAIAGVAALAWAWDNDFGGMRTTVEKFMVEIGPRWTAFVEKMKADWNSGQWLTDTLTTLQSMFAGPEGGDWGAFFTGANSGENVTQVTTGGMTGAMNQIMIQIFGDWADMNNPLGLRNAVESGVTDAMRQIGAVP